MATPSSGNPVARQTVESFADGAGSVVFAIIVPSFEKASLFQAGGTATVQPCGDVYICEASGSVNVWSPGTPTS
jgi:hypothetical protein